MILFIVSIAKAWYNRFHGRYFPASDRLSFQFPSQKTLPPNQVFRIWFRKEWFYDASSTSVFWNSCPCSSLYTGCRGTAYCPAKLKLLHRRTGKRTRCEAFWERKQKDPSHRIRRAVSSLCPESTACDGWGNEWVETNERNRSAYGASRILPLDLLDADPKDHRRDLQGPGK